MPAVRAGEAELAGDDAKHLTQVLRVEAGQQYEICDNENVYLAEVTVARKSQVVFRVAERLEAPEPPTPLTLLVSLIRYERLEDVFEKGTELGVTAFQLVKAERSEKGLEAAVPKRMPRWNRIVLEAGQQSRRARLPEINGPISLKNALGIAAAYRLLLDEERTGSSLLDVVSSAAPAALLIGPEGGWVSPEREAALAAGWHPVSLGPNILRTETAAIAAAAVLRSVFQRRTKEGLYC